MPNSINKGAEWPGTVAFWSQYRAAAREQRDRPLVLELVARTLPAGLVPPSVATAAIVNWAISALELLNERTDASLVKKLAASHAQVTRQAARGVALATSDVGASSREALAERLGQLVDMPEGDVAALVVRRLAHVGDTLSLIAAMFAVHGPGAFSGVFSPGGHDGNIDEKHVSTVRATTVLLAGVKNGNGGPLVNLVAATFATAQSVLVPILASKDGPLDELVTGLIPEMPEEKRMAQIILDARVEDVLDAVGTSLQTPSGVSLASALFRVFALERAAVAESAVQRMWRSLQAAADDKPDALAGALRAVGTSDSALGWALALAALLSGRVTIPPTAKRAAAPSWSPKPHLDQWTLGCSWGPPMGRRRASKRAVPEIRLYFTVILVLLRACESVPAARFGPGGDLRLLEERLAELEVFGGAECAGLVKELRQAVAAAGSVADRGAARVKSSGRSRARSGRAGGRADPTQTLLDGFLNAPNRRPARRRPSA